MWQKLPLKLTVIGHLYTFIHILFIFTHIYSVCFYLICIVTRTGAVSLIQNCLPLFQSEYISNLPLFESTLCYVIVMCQCDYITQQNAECVNKGTRPLNIWLSVFLVNNSFCIVLTEFRVFLLNSVPYYRSIGICFMCLLNTLCFCQQHGAKCI